MRTTLSINDALLRELRTRAAASGTSLRATVEQSIEIGLAHLSKASRAGRFRVRPHRLHLKAGFGGVSMNQLYDQIETEKRIPRA